MNMWPTTKIGDICTRIAMGPFGSNIKVENFVQKGVPVLNGSNLAGYILKEDNFNYVTEQKAEELKNSVAYRGDIVVTHRGTLGQIVYIPSESKYDKYVISQSQFLLRVNPDKADCRFVTYFFHSAYGQYLLLSNASQVGVPALARPTSTFKSLEIPLPPLKIQKQIADFMCLLDAKIQLNTQINRNLEQQAQAIFKSWFVDFEPFQDGKFVDSELGPIPDGGRIGVIGDIATISSGKRPVKKSESKSTNCMYPLIGASCIMGFTNDYLYDKPIVVTGRVGTHGVIQYFDEKCWPSDNTLVIQSQYINLAYMYLHTIDFKSLNRGSTQPLLTQSDIKKQHCYIPPEDTMINVEAKLSSIRTLIQNKLQENYRLLHLRDTLLPKLISGEIDVSEVEV